MYPGSWLRSLLRLSVIPSCLNLVETHWVVFCIVFPFSSFFLFVILRPGLALSLLERLPEACALDACFDTGSTPWRIVLLSDGVVQ